MLAPYKLISLSKGFMQTRIVLPSLYESFDLTTSGWL